MVHLLLFGHVFFAPKQWNSLPWHPSHSVLICLQNCVKNSLLQTVPQQVIPNSVFLLASFILSCSIFVLFSFFHLIMFCFVLFLSLSFISLCSVLFFFFLSPSSHSVLFCSFSLSFISCSVLFFFFLSPSSHSVLFCSFFLSFISPFSVLFFSILLHFTMFCFVLSFISHFSVLFVFSLLHVTLFCFIFSPSLSFISPCSVLFFLSPSSHGVLFGSFLSLSPSSHHVWCFIHLIMFCFSLSLSLSLFLSLLFHPVLFCSFSLSFISILCCRPAQRSRCPQGATDSQTCFQCYPSRQRSAANTAWSAGVWYPGNVGLVPSSGELVSLLFSVRLMNSCFSISVHLQSTAFMDKRAFSMCCCVPLL